MKTYKIALYPGDGIGQEVVPESVRILDGAAKTGGFALEFTSFPWGADYHDQHNVVTAEDYLDQLRPFDAIFLGAVGHPGRLPDHVTLAPLVTLRQSFDQYVCLRPARLYDGVQSPLRDAPRIDMIVLRENSEGEYIPIGGHYRRGRPDEIAVQTAVHSRRGIERILKFGFEMARKRRRRLTMITKSNALRYGYVLWDDVLEEMRGDFSDVETDRQHADAAAMDLVRRPEHYDVVVASNLFGDLLTELAGAICGGLGLAPSANIDPDRRYPSLFEPVHGSAPDIIGKGIANPIAAILSAAMMMQWLGEDTAASSIRQAVEAALRSGAATPDLGGKLTTTEMADRVLDGLKGRDGGPGDDPVSTHRL